MTAPGGSGKGLKVASLFATLDIKDNTGAQLSSITKRTAGEIQTTAQIARNSVAGIFGSLRTSASPAIEPLLNISEGFIRLGEESEHAGSKATKALLGVGAGL